ncbi:MAG: rod shape-determining protein RodA [Bacteroidetes bacterium]|nr:rod shape-determining protein RodA [Bacteroidota bacterium]
MGSARSAGNENPRLDAPSVWLYAGLVLIGLINIYSATSDPNQGFHFSFNSLAGRQMMWIGGAVLLILTIAFANVAVFDYFAYGFYALIILLNIAVIFLGREVAGARSWFGFGGVGIQPSEFAKAATALALARFLGTYGIRFKGTRNVFICLGLFLLPMGIILGQNDTGSALVFLAFFLVLYREGLPGGLLLTALWMAILGIARIVMTSRGVPHFWTYGILAVLGAVIIWFGRKNRQLVITVSLITISSIVFSLLVGFAYTKILKSYQRDRIELTLGLIKDEQGKGYHLHQSRIAIGAGQLVGRGFLKGTQTKMGEKSFVPEGHTDYIFCTISEEWGFAGVVVFFLIYFGLLFRLVSLAERQSTTFGRVLGYSVACILFFHIAINIGMTIGMVPTIGIPLPFVSFGGSSLWAFTLLLFTFLKVDEKRR